MTTTYREQMREILGPCAMCGDTKPPAQQWSRRIVDDHLVDQRAVLTEAEAQEFIDLYQAAEPDGLVRRVAHMFQPVCFRCDSKRRQHAKSRTNREKAREVRARLYNTGLMPEGARHITFSASRSEYEQRNAEAWEWGRAWTPEAGNAWIQGSPGVGKTYLTRCVANMVIEQGESAAEVSGNRICEVASWQFHERWRRGWTDVELLIVQDLEKATWDPAGIRFLFDILDRRLDSGRRMMFTANATPEQMSQRWRNTLNRDMENATVSALWERMLPMSRFELTGESIRRETLTAPATTTDQDDELEEDALL